MKVTKRVLKVPTYFDCPVTEAVFPRELLALPMAGADPTLNASLTAQAEELLAAIKPPQAGASFAAMIERTLKDGLAKGDLTLMRLANQMGLSVRTVQRRLRAAGLTHRELVRGLRHKLANQSLDAPIVRGRSRGPSATPARAPSSGRSSAGLGSRLGNFGSIAPEPGAGADRPLQGPSYCGILTPVGIAGVIAVLSLQLSITGWLGPPGAAAQPVVSNGSPDPSAVSPTPTPAPALPRLRSAPAPAWSRAPASTWVRVAPPSAPTQPMYRRWWFWTVVGAFTAGAALSVWLATRPGPEPAVGSLPPGVVTVP